MNMNKKKSAKLTLIYEWGKKSDLFVAMHYGGK